MLYNKNVHFIFKLMLGYGLLWDLPKVSVKLVCVKNDMEKMP